MKRERCIDKNMMTQAVDDNYNCALCGYEFENSKEIHTFTRHTSTNGVVEAGACNKCYKWVETGNLNNSKRKYTRQVRK